VEQILGYAPEEIVRKMHFYDLFTPDTYEETKAAAFEVISRRAPYRAFPHWNIGKDGRIVALETSGQPILDGRGNLLGYRGAATDVTERNQAEVMRSHLAAIVESCDDAIVGKTLDGVIVSWNAGAERLYGYKAPEMVGQRIGLVIPPDRRNELPEILARIRTEGHIEHYETQRIRKDGRRIEVALTISPIRNSAGTIIGASTIARDITDRKRAEAALRESEKRFRAMFFQASVGVAEVGLDYRWLLLNDRLCEILGYSRGELSGKTFLDITHPDDVELARNTVGQLLAGEVSSLSMEKRYVGKRGNTIWARLYTSLVRDEHGQPHYFIAVIEDVTDRKQAERALLDSELRLAMAHSAASLGVWDCDLGNDVINFSGEYARLFDLSPGQTSLTTNEWLALVHPDDRERILSGLPKSVEGMQTQEIEFRVLRSDGTVRWLLGKGAVFPGEPGRPARMSGVNFDITERKEAEEALRQSELLYKRIVEIIPECIFALDVTPEGRFIIAGFNPAEEEAVGLSNAEACGKFIEDLLSEETASTVIAHYRHCLETGTLIKYEEEVDMPAGRRRFYTSLIPIRDGSGVIHRIVGCCVDMTEMKHAQEAAFARQNLESLGVLASGIAHDFNNLLGGILATAELALSEHADGSSVEDELQRIKTLSIQGADIVRQLLTYGGQENPTLEPVNISLLVEEMLQLLRISISKHAVLKAELGPHLQHVFASPAQIRQIVMNLVINASEAIGERDGVIRVTTALVQVNQELRSAVRLPEGDYVRLEVSDTGSGMSSEVQARIFDPYFTTKSAGRGLGLAIMQRIVRGHGGAINVTSTPGQGTTFQVWLPCTDRKASAERLEIARTVERQLPFREGTVLIVEDEDNLRIALAKALRRKGFAVMEAADGNAAMDLVRGQRDDIDVILLDVTLPGISSREIFEEAQRGGKLKVILMSAYSKDTVNTSFSRLRIDRFIRKPFRLDDLVHELEAVLSG
jgi:PAS domain S-box-containing protein